MRLCKDCLFHRVVDKHVYTQIQKSHKCINPKLGAGQVTDLVTGKISSVAKSCYEMRDNHGPCGPNGIHFESNWNDY